MKVIYYSFLFAVLMLLASTATAQTSGTCGDNATWTYDTENKTLTISGTGAINDFKYGSATASPPWKAYDDIQTIIIENGITRIGNHSFPKLANLTSVTISPSVTSIGEYAFWNCPSLSITIPSTVTTIEGTDTFGDVESLEYHGSATPPTGYPSYGSWGAYSFNGSSFIFANNEKTILQYYIGKGGDIVVPEGVTTIGVDDEDEFCPFLSVETTIIFPESLTTIKNVIRNTSVDNQWLIKSIYFKNDPNNLQWTYTYWMDGSFICYVSPQTLDIWQEKFGDLENVYDIFFVANGVEFEQNGVVYILIEDGSATVKGYTATIPNELVIPSTITKDGVNYNVTNILQEAFNSCTKLTSVIIPDGVTKIRRSNFYECTNLTTVNIPEGVTTIGEQAFYGCRGLTSINIPESVTSFGEYAFEGVLHAEVWWQASPDVFKSCISAYGTPTYHVPIETFDAFNEKYGSKYNFVGDIKKISNDDITIPTQTYTGSALIPVVKDGEKTLVEGEDYTITLSEGGCINVGEYTVTLTGKKLYYKSAEKTFTITAKTLVSSNIADIAALTYTGSAFEPEVTVTDGTKTLAEGTDYTVEYSNNINSGTSAKVIVKGKGNYTGTAEKAFTINPKTLTASNVSNLAAQTYTGTAFEPEVTITDGTKTLVEGTDYTVEYSNNTNAGTSAKATITGKGNYTGTIEKTFTINPKTLVASNVADIAAQTYTGSAIEPDIDVTDGETTLVKGVDFTVTCSENINVGTATAIISGKGNYAGTVEKTFTITQATPTYTIPENLSLKCNQTLADITLPKGFAFDDINAELTLGKTITVTATFTPEDTKNYVAVKGIEIKVAVADHEYGEPVYTWSNDGKSCTATIKCTNASNHDVTEVATITSQVTTPASTESKGTTTYTATFKNTLFKTQTKAVEDIPQLTPNPEPEPEPEPEPNPNP
ncbi:MAG: leucine-rich repeat protein, partial [Bacteroidales bacterium]|nr:leucine-rich repeat protein [Bacteroidales bacterium]